jgi:hypothetical protein
MDAEPSQMNATPEDRFRIQLNQIKERSRLQDAAIARQAAVIEKALAIIAAAAPHRLAELGIKPEALEAAQKEIADAG